MTGPVDKGSVDKGSVDKGTVDKGSVDKGTVDMIAADMVTVDLITVEMVETEIRAGKKVIGYGASARSSTLLNFCGIDSRHLTCIADQSPLKHDRYTPGTNVLVVSPEWALAERPDTILLLAWNFRDEILGRLADAGFNGNVIVPLPNDPQLLKV